MSDASCQSSLVLNCLGLEAQDQDSNPQDQDSENTASRLPITGCIWVFFLLYSNTAAHLSWIC